MKAELNGKETADLMVDSGASSISLPWTLAVKIGLDPEHGDPITVQLADGTTRPAKRVVIPIVRVGAAVVKNVDCVVGMPTRRQGAVSVGHELPETLQVGSRRGPSQTRILGGHGPGRRVPAREIVFPPAVFEVGSGRYRFRSTAPAAKQ